MSITLACIGGRAAYDLLHQGALVAERIGPRPTPFGESQPVFRCATRFAEFYFLSRHGERGYHLSPSFVNYRANIYALKDFGVRSILAWSETRAISHNYKIGQYVVPDDVVDETVSRQQTFFENQGLGHVRQWPVFCPSLRKALLQSLAEEKCEVANRGVYVCVEGPRHETPAETRKYASYGGELLGQALVPEVFLARELEMCYTGLCYVAKYAEDGTNYRPFEDGRALPETIERKRATAAVERIPRILERFTKVLPQTPSLCECEKAMSAHTNSGELSLDWRTWFEGCNNGEIKWPDESAPIPTKPKPREPRAL